MTTLRPRTKRFNPSVVALAYDGLCVFEYACTAEVFGLPRPEFGAGWYRFATCSATGRPIKGQYGASLTVAGGLELIEQAGTVVIPGWQGIDADVPEPLLRSLRAAHRRGARLLSICSGAVVLAATGLLDGKRLTTHWRYAEALARRFPKVQVDPDVLYVDKGQVLTSAGSAAGLDLCLHLVRRDYGADVANQVARRLVIAPHREGGQAQFLDRPVDRRERGPLAVLLERLLKQLDKPLTIASMAKWAAMSERTFIRRFHASTGMTPGDWLTDARLRRARDLLESSALGIDDIAAKTGLGTASTLRHHFRKRVGISPSEYRSQFSQLP